MTRLHRLSSTAVTAVVVGCQSPAPHADPAAAAAVRNADSSWAEAFARRDMTSYLAFVDSTASIQQPNAPTVTGHAAIQSLVQSFFDLPGITGTWHPRAVEVAASADLAYSVGTYDLSYNGTGGGRVLEHGKYLEVWRKGSDGHWRMIVESFSPDTTPGAAQ